MWGKFRGINYEFIDEEQQMKLNSFEGYKNDLYRKSLQLITYLHISLFDPAEFTESGVKSEGNDCRENKMHNEDITDSERDPERIAHCGGCFLPL